MNFQHISILLKLSHRTEFHNYNIRSKDNIHVNKTKYKFVENSTRNQLPFIINRTDQNILSKIYTHSYQGFYNYVKYSLIQKYKLECEKQNCYVCKN